MRVLVALIPKKLRNLNHADDIILVIKHRHGAVGSLAEVGVAAQVGHKRVRRVEPKVDVARKRHGLHW